MSILIVGAGVTGCYTAARMQERGLDVAVLARGDRADRLERDGLVMRDGLTEEERTVTLRIVRAPLDEHFPIAMVCVQEIHRPKLATLLEELPGKPIIWYLGNTTKGFEEIGQRLGKERVLGGFPGVGGTWDGETLVFADRMEPQHQPFDKLVVGEAFPEAASAVQVVKDTFVPAGFNVEHYSQIMGWHWTHVAMVLPLAGLVYAHDVDMETVVADKALLMRTMRATAQALTAVKKAGHPILPWRLGLIRWLPAGLGARKVGSLFQSRFGQIALAGHASVARGEMQSLAADLMELAGADAGPDLRHLMDLI
ncbi:MAG: NAD(P)-binding protein [Proteobacteria bacterium]|jgi:2-dehydropantoate 2-reductase|nr:NAD(P)-binding protein [Pseudomonadota bacterium]